MNGDRVVSGVDEASSHEGVDRHHVSRHLFEAVIRHHFCTSK